MAWNQEVGEGDTYLSARGSCRPVPGCDICEISGV